MKEGDDSLVFRAGGGRRFDRGDRHWRGAGKQFGRDPGHFAGAIERADS